MRHIKRSLLEVLEAYRQTLLTERVGDLEQIAVFTVNSDNDKMVIQDEQKASGKALGMMLPYFYHNSFICRGNGNRNGYDCG